MYDRCMEERHPVTWQVITTALNLLGMVALGYLYLADVPPEPKPIRVFLPRSYFKTDAAWEANKRAIEDAVQRGEIVIEDLTPNSR